MLHWKRSPFSQICHIREIHAIFANPLFFLAKWFSDISFLIGLVKNQSLVYWGPSVIWLKTVFLEVKQFLINFLFNLFLFYTFRFLNEPIFFDHNPFFLTIETYESTMPQGHILFLRNPINDILGLPSHTPGIPLVQHLACCPSSGGTCSQGIVDMPSYSPKLLPKAASQRNSPKKYVQAKEVSTMFAIESRYSKRVISQRGVSERAQGEQHKN